MLSRVEIQKLVTGADGDDSLPPGAFANDAARDGGRGQGADADADSQWAEAREYLRPARKPSLVELVAEAEESGEKVLAISLACDPDLDGGGLAALVRLYGRCMLDGKRRVYLRHVSPEFRRELARVGLEGLIPVVD